MKNYKAVKKKLLKNSAIKASYDELAKAHFTKEQQKLIDLIDTVGDCASEFAFYDKRNYEVRTRLMNELDGVKKQLYDYVQRVCKTTNRD